jgi:HPt (histidine-containing phosphotransfer) domain-containing protein
MTGTGTVKMTVQDHQDQASLRPAPPIDHAHLARYTLGDRALELEVLQLFSGQAPSTLRDLETADGPKAWHMAAHTLKGSARAVGAAQVASAAADAESAGFGDPDRHQTVARLKAALDDVAAYIDRLARADGLQVA